MAACGPRTRPQSCPCPTVRACEGARRPPLPSGRSRLRGMVRPLAATVAAAELVCCSGVFVWTCDRVAACALRSSAPPPPFVLVVVQFLALFLSPLCVLSTKYRLAALRKAPPLTPKVREQVAPFGLAPSARMATGWLEGREGHLPLPGGSDHTHPPPMHPDLLHLAPPSIAHTTALEM
jgi:hypothetical protein